MCLFSLQGLCKRYQDHIVLSGADFEMGEGEIHCLLGQNGAGKSTLGRILMGMEQADAGEIHFLGQPYQKESPGTLRRRGMGLVHQEFSLMDGLSVAENLLLDREPMKQTVLSRIFGSTFSVVDQRKLKQCATDGLKSLGVSFPIEEKAGSLPVGQRKLLEACRELLREELRLLILDEPTDVMNGEEAEALFAMMEKRKKSGVSFLLITHRLAEALQAADRLSILKDGKMTHTFRRGEIGLEALSALLKNQEGQTCFCKGSFCAEVDALDSIEHELAEIEKGKEKNLEREALLLHEFGVKDCTHRLSLSIRPGEIVGFGGGAACTAFVKGLMFAPHTAGEAFYFGRHVKKGLLDLGAAVLPEDRRTSGILLASPLLDTACLPGFLHTVRFSSKIPFLRDKKRMQDYCQRMAQRMAISCESVWQKGGALSGGNQQKVAFAGALSSQPGLLAAFELLRGVDLSSREAMLEVLFAEAKKGMAVILCDSDDAFLQAVCDKTVWFLEDGGIHISEREERRAC